MGVNILYAIKAIKLIETNTVCERYVKNGNESV